MDATEVDRIVAALRAGRACRVPFCTTLYPDTRALENLLRARADGGFELTTTYVEFAAGHGYSTEMHETEACSEAQVRERLGWATEAEVIA